MRKLITLSLAALVCAFMHQATAQNSAAPPASTATDCPGVPGACGYHPNNTNRSQVQNPTPQNGNGTLGNTYNFTKCGLNFVTASNRLGQRFTPAGVPQPATFPIAGIPPCATIEKAYLYADASGNGLAVNATIKNPLNVTSSTPMTICGTGPDKCWGYSGTYTYRGDVTAAIAGNGNYVISGLPTNPPTSGNDVDGATLIIIYSDPTQTWHGTMIIDDGCFVVNGGIANYNMTFPAVCGPASNATAFCCLGDIQFNVTSLTMNGTATAFAWNWWNYVPTAATTVTAGQTSCNFNVNTAGDCFNLCVTGLYYQTSCTVCSALTLTTTSTPASCSACNGTATVTPNPPGAYTYTWSPAPGGGQGTPTATGLCAGTYTVTVGSGCSASTATVVVSSVGGGLTVTGTQTNVLCNGQCTGSATATATGGVAPYTYSWTPNTCSTATATNLCAGTYTCNVTDAAGCTGSHVFTITQPTALAVTTSFVTATCGNPDGSATVTVSGGTPGPGYTYSWSPVAGAGPTLSNIPAGAYTCTIHDNNGCTITVVVNVPNAGGPTVTMGTVTNITCFGSCNGSATVNATGGAPPLTYSWSPAPGAGQGTPTASSLCPGTYVCTVTDASGCSATASATITQPTQLVVTATSTNVTCFNACNGTGTSTVTGGTAPYTYSWTPSGGTGPNATSLCPGTYTITVTDANGCTANTTITITQPPQLTVTATSTNVTCNGACNGTMTCTAAGGTSPYTYSWSSGCLTQSCSNLCPGTYTITVTDANGCTATAVTTITQPAALAITSTTVSAHCNQADGSITVTVTGGTGTYTYSWSPGPGPNASTDPNLTPGNYTVYVTDANGCRDSLVINVPNIPGVLASITASTQPSCYGLSDGTITGSASAGTAPYTWSWSPAPGAGQGSPNATGVPAGTYTLTVTDSTGCLDTATIILGQPAQVLVTPMAPVTICIGSCTPLTATGSGGTPGYTFTWTQNATPVTSPVCPVVTTTYTVVSTDSHGCNSSPGTVQVIVNPALEVVTGGAASVCPGGCANLTSLPTGGNGGPYTFQWIPAAGLSSSTIQNPTACPGATTTYTVIVSDNCGTPTDSATVTVTVLPSPVPTITVNDSAGCAPLCVTFNGGSVPACASASWIFGDATTASGCGTQTHCYTTAGSFTVTLNITDINGCTAAVTKPSWINVYPIPQAHFTASPQPTTILSSVITFTDQSVGANSWNWSFGDLSHASSTIQNPQFNYPDTGCYQVQLVVTSVNGCKDTTSSPICISPDFVFYAPNAFTPNGDGKNDLFLPQGIGVDPNNYKLFIFDRWGNMIWGTTTWGEGWNGHANNGSDIAQIDTYVWKVELRDVLGYKHSFVGHVSILK